MNRQLEKLHEQLTTKNDIRTATIYSLRNWLAYRFLPVGDAPYIERAYHGAMAAFRRNEPHVRLFSLATFMAIEAGHFDTAGVMLDSALQYRNFLKANEPFYYGVFFFLRAYHAIKQQKVRTFKKYRKAFLSYVSNQTYSPHFDVMTGQLHIAALEFSQAYESLVRAYKKGCRSVYIYESLFRCCQPKGETIVWPGEELLDVLIYAAARGADIFLSVSAYEDNLFDAIRQRPEKGERLYTLSKQPSLLRAICSNRIENGDFSLEANKLYRISAENQLHINRLDVFLVQSAYINRIEDVNTYTLGQFLQSNERDPMLTIFAYHLVLTNPTHALLLQRCEEIIMQIAAWALDSGITSREANTLYQYYWERCKYKSNLTSKAETALQASLTQFELTPSPTARYLYISHPEKRSMEEYELPPDNSPITIDAGEGFSYVCLGAGKRQVVDKPVTIRRMVPLASPELYQHFFDNGDRRFHVVACLAQYYLEAAKSTARSTEKTKSFSNGVPVFEALLEDKTLQKSYRNQLIIALGHLYHQMGNHPKALENYGKIEMQSLEGTDLQKILDAYTQTNKYELAAALISEHYQTIPAPAVYDGLCKLLSYHENSASSNFAKNDATIMGLAQPAYNLLISGYYNGALLTFVLTHHKLSMSEMKVLSTTLENQHKIFDPTLDTQLLATSLWSSQYDTQTQKAFWRLQSAKKAQKECNEFVDLLTYAILTQNLIPEYETISNLEKICLGNPSDDYLLLALCHLYLKHKIVTLNSDKLIRHGIVAQEKLGILLPVFKENKPFPHPYLEKYQPFLFQSQPGKDIRLNYQLGSAEEFTSVPMEYLGYGLYSAKLPIFYNETITYYYSEEMPTGSIATTPASHKNTTPYLQVNHPDRYFAINNAIIYEQMFRHELVEEIVDGLVGDVVEISGGLL